MVPTLFFYHLGLVALGCVFLMLCWLWPNDAASPHQPIVPTKPSRRKHSKEPKPFAGLTQRPSCALCEREATQAHEPPPTPPAPMPPTTPPAAHCGYLAALLPPWGLSLSRLAGAGQSARQWPSQWRPLAPIPVHRVRGVFPRTPRYDLPWQAGRRGTHWARAGVLSRGARYSRHRPSLRGRPQHRAGLAGGSGGAAHSLFRVFPL